MGGGVGKKNLGLRPLQVRLGRVQFRRQPVVEESRICLAELAGYLKGDSSPLTRLFRRILLTRKGLPSANSFVFVKFC